MFPLIGGVHKIGAGSLGPGNAEWRYEGVAGYVHRTQVPASVPFHRYLNLVTQDHFYTTSWDELGEGGGDWLYEGIACYLPTLSVADTSSFHRYLNLYRGDHFYSASFDELGQGNEEWFYEGVAGLIFTGP